MAGWRTGAVLMTLAEETVSNQPTHVLLIEDSQGDADLVRLRLVETNSGLDVSCVDRLSTGLAALAVKPPAVVLLDLNLPDSHGAETFRNVLNQAPGVPVVVLSGMEDEELALEAVHQGVQDYLVKGAFDGKQLARSLRYAIARHALLPAFDMNRTQPAIQPLEELERWRIIHAVNEVGAMKAARFLGIGKTTVYRKLKLYQALPPGRKSRGQSRDLIGGPSYIMQGKQQFELWKEYYGDLLRETERAYTQGATQEEAKNRVEHWLVAKYADKFLSQVVRLPERRKGQVSEGARMTR
jgi:DNA-binding NarL/FixJ family response regulator